MKKDDFLSDIEEDVSKNWKDIQKDFQDLIQKKVIENRKKTLKDNPVVPHLSYDKFYGALIDLLYWDSYSVCRENIGKIRSIIERMFFFFEENHIPESFKNVWNIFCNTKEYEHLPRQCENCKTKWDIIYRRLPTPILFDFNQRLVEERIERVKRMDIRCPKCAWHIVSFANSDLIGIFEHGKRKK